MHYRKTGCASDLTRILRIKEISHEVDGPAVIQEDLDQLIRELASTRQLREFRKSGRTDFTYAFCGTLFLIRIVQAFDEFRLDFLIIEKLRGNTPARD